MHKVNLTDTVHLFGCMNWNFSFIPSLGLLVVGSRQQHRHWRWLPWCLNHMLAGWIRRRIQRCTHVWIECVPTAQMKILGGNHMYITMSNGVQIQIVKHPNTIPTGVKTCISRCTCACVYACMHACMCVYVRMQIFVYTYTYMYYDHYIIFKLLFLYRKWMHVHLQEWCALLPCSSPRPGCWASTATSVWILKLNCIWLGASSLALRA